LVGVDLWRFTAELEVYKRPLYDEQWFTIAPEYLTQSDIVDIAVNEKWPGVSAYALITEDGSELATEDGKTIITG
ncbi:hypothetical protein HP547_28125, partial [Pseudomonas sp. CrR7]|nr:hypothetical protein [Pseudomonas sp. CM27]